MSDFLAKAMEKRRAFEAAKQPGDDDLAFNCPVSKGMQRVVKEWLMATVYPEIIEIQKKQPDPDQFYKSSWANGYPYGGPISSGASYHFTPTSIGTMCHAEYNAYGKKYTLDLNDWTDFG